MTEKIHRTKKKKKQRSLAQILDNVDKTGETQVIELKPRARRKRRAKKASANLALNAILDALVFPNPSDF